MVYWWNNRRTRHSQAPGRVVRRRVNIQWPPVAPCLEGKLLALLRLRLESVRVEIGNEVEQPHHFTIGVNTMSQQEQAKKMQKVIAKAWSGRGL